MTENPCIERAVEEAKKSLTDEEISFFLSSMEEAAEMKKGYGKLKYTEDRLLNHADEMANSIKEEALIQKRNAALTMIKKQKVLDFVNRFDNPG